MPANLNALIRYKTINNCLHGGRRRWSIEELIGACSDALAEARGRYAKLSERTIRDDIRIMRSDILGFNAPIKQERGLYFYTDPSYSIMAVGITDPGLLDTIIRLLLDLRGKIAHPELEIVLGKLLEISPVVSPEVKTEKTYNKQIFHDFSPLTDYARLEETDLPSAGPAELSEVNKFELLRHFNLKGIVPSGITAVLWGDVLKLLGSGIKK